MASQYKNEYEKDLSIDKYKLDEELIIHGDLFMKWSERYADAIEERDKSKENIDIVRAGIDKDIRDNYENYDFDKKPTESAISNTIITQKKYREAINEHSKNIHSLNIITSAREAMGQFKMKRLDKLVDLWLAGYWADVSPKNKNKLDTKMRSRKARITN